MLQDQCGSMWKWVQDLPKQTEPQKILFTRNRRSSLHHWDWEAPTVSSVWMQKRSWFRKSLWLQTKWLLSLQCIHSNLWVWETPHWECYRQWPGAGGETSRWKWGHYLQWLSPVLLWQLQHSEILWHWAVSDATTGDTSHSVSGCLLDWSIC